MKTLQKSIYTACTALLLSLSLSCSNSKPQTEQNHAEHAAMDHSKMDHSKHESMEAGTPSDLSIYNLESSWTNQDAQQVHLKDLGNKVQLIAMIYSSCKNACPRIIADMKRIEAEVEEKYKNQVNLVLVSIDPEVDTPEKLKTLAQKSHLEENWTLLRGEADDVLELAALLGVKYKKISETDYAHSNMISVLNPQGEIKHQQIGLGVEPQETLDAIQKLLKT